MVAAVLATIVLIAAGCDAIGSALRQPQPPAEPQPCAQLFNPVRCLAMIDTAASRLRVTPEDVTALIVIPQPTPEVLSNGDVVINQTSGGHQIDVSVTLKDDTSHAVTFYCVGVNNEPACSDDPHIDVGSIMHGGYFDTPEGSSPVPSAAPDALAEATELRLDGVDIAIDHVGAYEVRLGEAWLPNGLLTQADFALVDDWPPDFTILEGGVRIKVRSLDDGKPINNIYEHRWREGVEPVEAFLLFDVFRFDPGARLSISDVVVR